MLRSLLLTALAASTLAVPAAAEPAPVSGDVVHTTHGDVRGVVTPSRRTFFDIPYAAPPTGADRWKAPRPAASWTGVRDGTTQGPICPQPGFFPGDPAVVGQEDCLRLTVDTPRDGHRAPVMLFVHGGGFTGGAGAPYDPGRLVAAGVTVVTVNYRLGALGFLDHPGMRDPYAGNFGIADQQAALRWVRDNIGRFGGDPRNVTLWGESAGAYSVCAQLASPAARGLFHKAISQSGPCGNDLLTRSAAEHRGTTAAAELGCPDPATALSCLRAKPFEQLTGLYQDRTAVVHKHIAELPWFPVAGTPVLLLQPRIALAAGWGKDIPLLQGGTKDEMRAFVGSQYVQPGKPITAAQYPRLVRDLFGHRSARILRTYPLSDYANPSIAYATVLGDYGRMVGSCSQLPTAKAAARWAPVYAYEFAEPSGVDYGDFPLGATHGDDVPYFFDGRWPGAPAGGADVTEPPRRLAEQLVAHWTRFARTGSPGWSTYRNGIAMSFTSEHTGFTNVATAHHCDLWKTTP